MLETDLLQLLRLIQQGGPLLAQDAPFDRFLSAPKGPGGTSGRARSSGSGFAGRANRRQGEGGGGSGLPHAPATRLRQGAAPQTHKRRTCEDAPCDVQLVGSVHIALLSRQPATGFRSSLTRETADAINLLCNFSLDNLSKIFVKPLFEHRLEQFADNIIQRTSAGDHH